MKDPHAQPVKGQVVIEPAPLIRRFGALMIDWLLCLLASGLFANPRTQPWAPVVVLVLVYTVFVGFFGMTPGMRLAGIRCVRYRDAGLLGPVQGFVRGLLLALFIPALIMDGEQRGLHDRAGDSIVIPAPSK